MGLGDWFGSLLGGSARVDLWKRFERMRESSSGTMSVFYKVRDLKTGEILGLKVVDAAKAAPVEARYKTLGKPGEGEIGQQITGPSIVRIKEWGTATSGDPFIVQEYVDGPLLHNLIAAKKAFSPAQKIDLVTQAATAIKVVHDAGFVHRDICPRNFILEAATGRLVLIDFGLTVPDRPAYLQPGNRVGTPSYMAPEVVRRRQADKRLDIFSFGITAYEICTNASPWPKGSTGKAALAHDTPPADIRESWPEIPHQLATAIMSCLAADPDRRPPSMDRFLAMIAGVKA